MRTTMRVFKLSTFVLFVSALADQTLAEPVVGAYYYPWYSASDTFGHNPNVSVRGHTLPRQSASLGAYNSFDPATVSSHIDQSHRGNIDFWALSWWGPNHITDRAIRQTIMPHARASELEYAIHYETQHRLGNVRRPDYRNLVGDFRYLADNYFHDPDYLRIDGRPVVFMYLTRAFFNEQISRDVVANLRSTIRNEYGYDPFIVGDDVFAGEFNSHRAQFWDAVTDYDVYGTSLQSQGSTTAGLDQLANVYDETIDALAGTGVGFIPAASPGFNDKGVRDHHATAPRYLLDSATAQPGDLFEQMLTDVAVPRIDPDAGNLLMINSFNEWHEDTQIEQSVVSRATRDDDSGRRYFTEGYAYEGYGGRYLDILRETTLTGSPITQSSLNLLDDASFLHALYESVLDRRADAGGINVWMTALQDGTPRNEVAESFMLSGEQLGRVVDQHYWALLGRPADPVGRAHWVKQLMDGMGGPDIVVSFLTSAEYLAAHPNNAAYVRGIYEDILHRPADPGGLAHFVSELSGGRDRAEIVLAILNSAERRDRVIDSLYRDFLGRGVDPTGLEAFAASIASGEADLNDVAFQLLASNEFSSLAQRRLDSSDWVYWNNVGLSLPANTPASMSAASMSATSAFAVPEPSTLMLTASSLVILTVGHRRRRTNRRW